MRKLLISTVSSLALAAAQVDLASAQSTRTQLYSQNNSSFYPCGTYCITGEIINGFMNTLIESLANLSDANTFTGNNTFTGPTHLPSSVTVGGLSLGTATAAAPFGAAGVVSGSTVSSPASRASNNLNVVDDFGADPTGVADSTSALNAAMTAGAYGAAIINMPCGTYKTSNAVVVPASTVVHGDTNYAWLFGYGISVGSGSVVPISHIKPCVIVKPAPSANWASAKGVFVLGGWTHINGVGVDQSAINSQTSFYTNMPFDTVENSFSNGGVHSMWVDSPPAGVIAQGTILRNNFFESAVSGDCVLMGVTADFQILNNDFDACSGSALNLAYGSDGRVLGNVFGESLTGLRLGTIFAIVVANNTFIGNYYEGIDVTPVVGNMTISNNAFQANATNNQLNFADIYFDTGTRAGCITWEGNNFVTTRGLPEEIFFAQAGASFSCDVYNGSFPAQSVGVFAPLASGSNGSFVSANWSGGTATFVTNGNHGLMVGEPVTIYQLTPSGYDGTFNVASTPNANTFTVSMSNPGAEAINGGTVGLSGGSTTVSIASGSWSGGVETLTTSAPHGLSTGNTVVVASTDPAALDGTYVATVTSGTTLTIPLAVDPGTYVAASGYAGALAISGITWSGGVATVTTAATHGITTTGVQVVISNASPSGYNGTYWATVTGTNTFTVPISVNPGTETTPGWFTANFTQALVQPMINYVPNGLPGPYANDAAASSAGVPIGAEYRDTSGVRRQRVS